MCCKNQPSFSAGPPTQESQKSRSLSILFPSGPLRNSHLPLPELVSNMFSCSSTDELYLQYNVTLFSVKKHLYCCRISGLYFISVLSHNHRIRFCILSIVSHTVCTSVSSLFISSVGIIISPEIRMTLVSGCSFCVIIQLQFIFF